MILGVLVSVIQFLGFPDSWNKIFYVFVGVLIIGIAYNMAIKVNEVDTKTLPYEEHKSDQNNIGESK